MDIKVIRSGRKTLCLEIKPSGEVILRAPFLTSQRAIDDFLQSKRPWLERHLAEMTVKKEPDEAQKEEMRQLAKRIIPPRVEYYANIMGLKPSSVRITSAKRSFGSCSAKNSLCFSLYLMSYPERAIDYVVIHELAHIKHKNHGKEFYSLIEKYMPDYKEAKNELRK